jgi:hypothetical protein
MSTDLQESITMAHFGRRMFLLVLVPSFQILSGMASVAHGWVQSRTGFWVCALLFLSGPVLAWKAWRGSSGSGICLIAFGLLALWFPPWALFSPMKMAVITVVALSALLAWLWLSYRVPRPVPQGNQ